MKIKGNITADKEQTILLEFQEAVLDLKQENESLLRFLKYNGYNLCKAEQMLRKSVKWYKDNNVSSYLNWNPPQPVADDYKFESIGEDYDGYSVIYIPIGEWQMKRIMEIGYREESLEFRFYLLEKIMDSIKTTKRSKFVLIMDMEGLTFKKCTHYDTVQFLSLAFKDFEENYPERLRACYIINAPWAFSYIYSAMKHVFSSRTLDKAKIFDSDQSKWKPFLLEKIPKGYLTQVFREYSACVL